MGQREAKGIAPKPHPGAAPRGRDFAVRADGEHVPKQAENPQIPNLTATTNKPHVSPSKQKQLHHPPRSRSKQAQSDGDHGASKHLLPLPGHQFCLGAAWVGGYRDFGHGGWGRGSLAMTDRPRGLGVVTVNTPAETASSGRAPRNTN